MRHKEFMTTGKIFGSLKVQRMPYYLFAIFFLALYYITKDFTQILSDIYSILILSPVAVIRVVCDRPGSPDCSVLELQKINWF